MATEGRALPRGKRSPGEPVPFNQAEYNDANANRALTAALSGTCVAVLTFVLFFLYGRWTSGEISNLLFQATVLTVVGALFLISLSSMNFWFVMEALWTNHPRPERYLARAEALFSTGWVLLTLEPALILFTVRIYYAATAALALWLISLLVLGIGWRDARRPVG